MQSNCYRSMYLSVIIWSMISINYIVAQRCIIQNSQPVVQYQKSHSLLKRSPYSFQIIFHVLYTNDYEKISLSQIYSQMEILNEVFNVESDKENQTIPLIFRDLKANPNIRFCLADKDPNGNPSNGINLKQIHSKSLACKREFGMRSIMHESLGGIDVWDPTKYINVYVINRDECKVLGEAIFPWNASLEEYGIILDFRAVGSIGTSSDNIPFHKGLTLVHELGHFFGLLHLSADSVNCKGDDFVEDTPIQSKEYFGCPSFPKQSCGTIDMSMNYMSLVDDACMRLFTKGQVMRMHEIIETFRKTLDLISCSAKAKGALNDIIWVHHMGIWQLLNTRNEIWTANLELYDVNGKLIWKDYTINSLSFTFPKDGFLLPVGIYFLRVYDESHSIQFKLIKYP
jgi:hypothetical protein